MATAPVRYRHAAAGSGATAVVAMGAAGALIFLVKAAVITPSIFLTSFTPLAVLAFAAIALTVIFICMAVAGGNKKEVTATDKSNVQKEESGKEDGLDCSDEDTMEDVAFQSSAGETPPEAEKENGTDGIAEPDDPIPCRDGSEFDREIFTDYMQKLRRMHPETTVRDALAQLEVSVTSPTDKSAIVETLCPLALDENESPNFSEVCEMKISALPQNSFSVSGMDNVFNFLCSIALTVNTGPIEMCPYQITCGDRINTKWSGPSNTTIYKCNADDFADMCKILKGSGSSPPRANAYVVYSGNYRDVAVYNREEFLKKYDRDSR
jgi:hypothetical protein